MKNKKQQSRQLAKCLEAMRKGKSSAEDYMTQYPHIAAELKLATALMAESQVLFEAEQDHARKRMIRSKVMSNLENRTFAVTNSKDSRYILHNLKRRFAMSWIIILTTVLSLVSGGGIVYASGNALPGEMLYPVKTWVEDVRLAVASNGTDVGLHFKFTENRMYEIRALLENGEIADLQAGLDGYENHARLLAQTMAKIQAQDPEQATRLRADLESKLHEQARRMEEWMADPEESDPYSQERLRTML